MDIDANAIAVDRKQRAEDRRCTRIEAALRTLQQQVADLLAHIERFEAAPAHSPHGQDRAAKRLGKRHG